jgi:hypothetical protein
VVEGEARQHHAGAPQGRVGVQAHREVRAECSKNCLICVDFWGSSGNREHASARAQSP